MGSDGQEKRQPMKGSGLVGEVAAAELLEFHEMTGIDGRLPEGEQHTITD